jgi:hypothetical protein
MSDQTIREYPPAPGDGDAAAAPDAPKRVSRWEDFIDIFYAPSSVFARREHSGFGVPMLVVTLALAAIGLATFNAMSPIMDAEFSRATASAMKKGVTAEQMQSMRSMGEKIGRIMLVIIPPIMIFLTGVVLWMCGKFVSARQTVGAAIMVAAYANVPRILGKVLEGAQALLMDPSQLNGRYAVTLSVARFLDRDTVSPVLYAFAGRMELFTIWATVLLAIGLAVTGRIPRNRAAIAAALVWLIGSLPDISTALRQ